METTRWTFPAVDGSVAVAAGDGNDTLGVSASAIVGGSLNARLGEGDNSFSILGTVDKSVFYSGRDGNDAVDLQESASVGQHALVKLGNGENQLTHAGSIGGNLIARSRNENDSVVLLCRLVGSISVCQGQTDCDAWKTWKTVAYSAILPNVLSVGAHTSGNRRAAFSNKEGAAVQVDALGVNVYSTIPGNRYASWSGASMAAPHVSGLAALALSANPTLTASQLRELITGGATRSVAGSDSRGGIDSVGAVSRALALS